MRESSTPYGRLIVAERDALFARVVTLAEQAFEKKRPGPFTWALSGGGTPRDWYAWALANQALKPSLVEQTHFTVSDERMVPLTSEDSNFGVAERLLLSPLDVAQAHRHPWPISHPPAEAAELYREEWSALTGSVGTYDVCMLGMGEDAHTASFFPGTPLFEDDGGVNFAAIDAGKKGWRLTITPSGLRSCGSIVVLALGAGKARALERVMRGDEPWNQVPAKILATASDRVTWLVDEAALEG